MWKTTNNTNGYDKTLTGWVSAFVISVDANIYDCDTGNAIPELWDSVLKSFCHSK
jgi:hypothetical protein